MQNHGAFLGPVIDMGLFQDDNAAYVIPGEASRQQVTVDLKHDSSPGGKDTRKK